MFAKNLMSLVAPLLIALSTEATILSHNVSQSDSVRLASNTTERFSPGRLSLIEKIEIRIVQKRLQKIQRAKSKTDRKADVSLGLGLGSTMFLALALVSPLGFLFFLSIPMALLGIIFGAQVLKQRKDKRAKIGIFFGSLTLALVLFFVIASSNGLG